MTDAARAAAEAVAREWLEENISAINQRRIASLADCLLAFAAAQRAEEREACALVADEYCASLTWNTEAGRASDAIARAIRARREGTE